MFAQEVQETPKAISTVAVALGTSQKTLLLKKPQTFDTGFRGSKLNATESSSVRTSLRRLKKCCKLPRGERISQPYPTVVPVNHKDQLSKTSRKGQPVILLS